MAAKVEIQIRFISKHHVNDYISTISKNYLSTFTGQQWNEVQISHLGNV